MLFILFIKYIFILNYAVQFCIYLFIFEKQRCLGHPSNASNSQGSVTSKVRSQGLNLGLQECGRDSGARLTSSASQGTYQQEAKTASGAWIQMQIPQ